MTLVSQLTFRVGAYNIRGLCTINTSFVDYNIVVIHIFSSPKKICFFIILLIYFHKIFNNKICIVLYIHRIAKMSVITKSPFPIDYMSFYILVTLTLSRGQTLSYVHIHSSIPMSISKRFDQQILG